MLTGLGPEYAKWSNWVLAAVNKHFKSNLHTYKKGENNLPFFCAIKGEPDNFLNKNWLGILRGNELALFIQFMLQQRDKCKAVDKVAAKLQEIEV